MKPPYLSPEFLADLRMVAPALRETHLSQEFRNDLVAANSAVCEPETQQSVSPEELKLVAEHLEEWRSRTRQEVKERLSALPEDDPILCPISLFATMDYGRLETAHTRALAWLLDPNKEHGFGSRLIKALLWRLGRRLPDQECKVEKVESEKVIGTSRRFGATGRIDVFAEGHWIGARGGHRPWRLAIEAKIDALESDEQLLSYEEWLDSIPEKREVFRVFVTPDRRTPTTAKQDWPTLSFQDLVEVFRAECSNLTDRPGYQFLRLYLAGVLRNVCRWPSDIKHDCPDPYSVLHYLQQVTATVVSKEIP